MHTQQYAHSFSWMKVVVKTSKFHDSLLWTFKIKYVTLFYIVFNYDTLSKGPRGLNGPRGRPGPPGQPVSKLFSNRPTFVHVSNIPAFSSTDKKNKKNNFWFVFESDQVFANKTNDVDENED